MPRQPVATSLIVYVADGHRSKETEPAVAVAKDRGITGSPPRALVADLAAAPHHQGIVAVAGEFPYARADQMLAAAAAAGEAPLLLILDCITDPQNFGALVRSAEVLGPGQARGADDGVVKASAEASERVRIAACRTCSAPSTGCASRAWRCGAAPRCAAAGGSDLRGRPRW